MKENMESGAQMNPHDHSSTLTEAKAFPSRQIPFGCVNAGGGLMERMYDELNAYRARDLAESNARADAARKQLAEVQAEKDRLENTLVAQNEQILKLQNEFSAKECELEKERKEKARLEEEQAAFEWLVPAFNACVDVSSSLDGILKGAKTAWYTDQFSYAVWESLMSVHFQLSLENPFIDPAKTMKQIDGVFFRRLGQTDSTLGVLEEARQQYMGLFNAWSKELNGGRYEIRWPRTGEKLDPTFCKAREDNGMTGVRVAEECAVFENGQVKSMAIVQTVAAHR